MSDKVKEDKKMSFKHKEDKLRLNLSCVGRLIALQQGRIYLPTKVKGDYKRVCDEIMHLQKNNYQKNKHAHDSIMFLLNSNPAEFEVCRKDCEKMLNHRTIECSSGQHTSSCLLSFVMFPAKLHHGSVSPKLRGRVSLQMQIERNKHHYFGDSPKEVNCAIAQDINDPLFQLMTTMTQNALSEISKGKKMDSFKAIGKAAH